MKFIRKYTYYLRSIFTLLFGVMQPLKLIAIFLRKDTPTLKIITLRTSGLTFTVRGKMDIWSLKETLLDHFYEKYGTPIQPDWTIMDIGAAIGEFTILAARSAPQGKVISYEPYLGSFELLQTNLKINRINNVTPYNQAIWSTTGTLALDTAAGEPLQIISTEHPVTPSPSLSPTPALDTAAGEPPLIIPIEPSATPSRTSALSLADALSANHIAHLDLLKLDCEGAEYPILLHSAPALFARIARIVMEVHDNAHSHNHIELTEFLNSQNYRTRLTPNPVHPHLGYLYAEKK